jgi:drug/metabolite transporter (DMT)-like permease
MTIGTTGSSWIFLALLSALFSSARFLYLKKWCSHVSPAVLVFSTRALGTLVLLPGLWANPVTIANPGAFARALAVTVVLTAAATVVQVRVIQKESLSQSLPFLSLTPLFMVPWTILLFHDTPSGMGGIGLGAACVGAYVIKLKKGMTPIAPFAALFRDPGSRYMLLVALALGCTTVCDKIAIGASSAYGYTLVWTAASTVFMLALALRHPPKQVMAALFNKHTAAQAVLWTGGFLLQMAAVKASMGVPSGVTYVKMLTLFNVLIPVGVAGQLFGEGKTMRSFISALLMVAGAMLAVFSAH